MNDRLWLLAGAAEVELQRFVVGDANPSELDALCLDQIARFKCPREYRFVAALPKNNCGKVPKTELRRQIGA